MAFKCSHEHSCHPLCQSFIQLELEKKTNLWMQNPLNKTQGSTMKYSSLTLSQSKKKQNNCIIFSVSSHLCVISFSCCLKIHLPLTADQQKPWIVFYSHRFSDIKVKIYNCINVFPVYSDSRLSDFKTFKCCCVTKFKGCNCKRTLKCS